MSAHTQLRKYLDKRKLSPAAFAAQVGAHRSQLYRLLENERGPSVELAAKIEKATDGAVRAVDWA